METTTTFCTESTLLADKGVAKYASRLASPRADVAMLEMFAALPLHTDPQHYKQSHSAPLSLCLSIFLSLSLSLSLSPLNHFFNNSNAKCACILTLC